MSIELKDVTKAYESYNAIEGVNLQVGSGEFVFIGGRSGSGKTTLLSVVAGLTRPTSGEVFIDGVKLWSLNDRELSSLRNRKIGFMFQGGYVISTLNVMDNVLLPATFGGIGSDPRRRCEEALTKVGLSGKEQAFPSDLSGGQRRRISIARALMNDPEIILADEPTAELDVETEEDIMEMLRDVHRAGGVTMLMVSHNYDLAGYATRRFKMSAGKLTELSGEAAFGLPRQPSTPNRG